MNLHLLRHPRPVNANGLCYGRTNVALGGDINRHAAALRARVQGDVGEVVSSPLTRCLAPAEALAIGPVSTDTRLMELDFGLWEGQPWAEVPRAEIEAWSEDVVDRPCPGGESYAALYRRAVEAFADLRTRNADTVTVVTHGGVIRALIAHALDIPLTRALDIAVDYGGCTTFSVESDTTRVLCVNR